MFRRQFIKATSVAAIGGITAGCMGGEEPGGTETETSTPTDTPTPTDTSTSTPTPEDAADAPATVTPEDIEGEVANDIPSNLEVSNHQIVAEENWAVTGDIMNTGNEAVESATASVTLYDGDTQVAKTTTSIQEEQYDDIQSIPPGETWTFRAVFTENIDWSQVSRYVVGVSTGGGGTSTGTPAQNVERVVGNTPDGIKLQDTQLFITGNNNARVTGSVKNTTNENFEELEVQATLIDDQNDILGKWFDDTEEREAGGLGAGKTWNFTVEFESPDLDTVARYRVDVDGEIDGSVWDG